MPYENRGGGHPVCRNEKTYLEQLTEVVQLLSGEAVQQFSERVDPALDVTFH